MCFCFFSLGNKTKSIFALFGLFLYPFIDCATVGIFFTYSNNSNNYFIIDLPEANKYCAYFV